METPISLYDQFKKDHPETIGEKDIAFDKANYIDWLEGQIQSNYITLEQHEEDKKEVGEILNLAVKMLNHIGCVNPSCDRKGAIQVAEDEWEPCQWCDELKKITGYYETKHKTQE